MKKRLTYSVLSTIIVYLLVSFVKWDLLCFLEIPNLDSGDRFVLLMTFIVKELVVSAIVGLFE